MINYQQALDLVNKKISNKNLVKHCLASSEVMGGLYDYMTSVKSRQYDSTREEWVLAGLLHDLDYEQVAADNYKGHGLVAAEQLRDQITPAMYQAIAAHGHEFSGILPNSDFDWCLRCGETLTGLVVAAALVLPSKKLADLTVESILNRFKEKSFAKGVSREVLLECDKIGLSLEELIIVGLKSMQGISEPLGL